VEVLIKSLYATWIETTHIKKLKKFKSNDINITVITTLTVCTVWHNAYIEIMD